ncbi:MAG TPA: THUMP domain-containing protein [Candidatus Thermoplasmatota archaeon]
MTKKPRAAKVAAPAAAKRSPPPAPSRTPNILVTIDERHRERAGEEIVSLLGRAGYSNCEITANPGTGLIGVFVDTPDSRACIPKLKQILMDAPFAFQHTHRWLPVESWAAPDAAELAKFAKLAGAEIGNEASWGIVVERHNSALDRGLIVNTLAKGIDNPHVSLDAPEKTVLVEVVGTKAAMSVLGKDEQLSVDKSLREDFVQFEEVSADRKDG